MRLLSPLFLLLVALAIGLFLWGRGAPPEARRARTLAFLALGFFALVGSGDFANLLHRAIESPVTSAPLDAPERTAVVLLTAGLRTRDERFPKSEQLGPEAQGRTIGAARLARSQPFAMVLISGTPGEQVAGMAELLARLGVDPARIVLEDTSEDTRESAAFSAKILREHGLTRAAIVTSAVHLPRSVRYFQREGIDAIPAPADVHAELVTPGGLALGLVPTPTDLLRTQYALHELFGKIPQAL